jgi:hypothetical protein
MNRMPANITMTNVAPINGCDNEIIVVAGRDFLYRVPNR